MPDRKRSKSMADVMAELAGRKDTVRGEAKLRAALTSFGVVVHDRIALDAGASTGGFTRVLLEYGAKRVYAVEAGHGQLLGSLRQNQRVVNLEGTNLGLLTGDLVPDAIDVVTLDLSYLSLAEAIPQLALVTLASRCDLIALVKPMFELKLGKAPKDDESVVRSTALVSEAAKAAGWDVRGTIPSPVTGARGAVEGLLHATLSR